LFVTRFFGFTTLVPEELCPFVRNIGAEPDPT